jgi:hypothetical protein
MRDKNAKMCKNGVIPILVEKINRCDPFSVEWVWGSGGVSAVVDGGD